MVDDLNATQLFLYSFLTNFKICMAAIVTCDAMYLMYRWDTDKNFTFKDCKIGIAVIVIFFLVYMTIPNDKTLLEIITKM